AAPARSPQGYLLLPLAAPRTSDAYTPTRPAQATPADRACRSASMERPRALQTHSEPCTLAATPLGAHANLPRWEYSPPSRLHTPPGASARVHPPAPAPAPP